MMSLLALRQLMLSGRAIDVKEKSLNAENAVPLGKIWKKFLQIEDYLLS
jgi:hypothetical protein